MDEIKLEDYYLIGAIKTTKKETLLNALNFLPEKKCLECGKRLKYKNTKGNTRIFCSNKCSGKSAISQEKVKSTNLKKYKVEYATQLKSTQEKIKKTNIKKYLVEYTMQNKDILEKRGNTNISIYGSKCSAKNITVKSKMEETKINNIIKKYSNKFSGKLLNTDNGYEYICDICGKSSIYNTIDERIFISRRFRFGIIPCNYCLPREKGGRNKRSNIEIKLEKTIKGLGIKTEHKHSIDIFLPDYNIGIEVNGHYWHSDLHREDNFHKKKLLKFKDKGIQLLSFTDLELYEKYEVIVNYIKGKLGLLPSIGASKCKIREINTKTAKDFCEKYHIHGYSGGIKKYGLFLKEELVSVCVIGKNRFEKNNKSIEIIRLCNSCKVIGGFGRFLKIIKKDFEGNKITTFINAYLGLPDNNVFTKNGFILTNHTKPNYNWILNQTSLSRQKCMKHKLIKIYGDIGNTENEIMRKLGGYKLYDAGNYKFEYVEEKKELN